MVVDGAVLENPVAGNFTELNTDAVYNISKHGKLGFGKEVSIVSQYLKCLLPFVSFIFLLVNTSRN